MIGDYRVPASSGRLVDHWYIGKDVAPVEFNLSVGWSGLLASDDIDICRWVDDFVADHVGVGRFVDVKYCRAHMNIVHQNA